MRDVETVVGQLKGYALSLDWTNADTQDAVLGALDPNRHDNFGSYHMAYLRVHNAVANMYEAVVMQKTLAGVMGRDPGALVKFYDFMQGLGITQEELEAWKEVAKSDAGIS